MCWLAVTTTTHCRAVQATDKLQVQAGLDTLNGGSGKDTLIGGADADTFVFADGFSTDRIGDFANNHDVLQLDDALWGGGLTAQQVVNMFASNVGSSAVFDFGGGDVLTVVDVGKNALVDDIIIV